MLRKLSILAIIVIIFYTLGFMNIPFLFILFLNIVTLLSIFFLLKYLLTTKKKTHQVLISSFLFFLLSGWIINRYCLPDMLHPISLLGDIGILIFTLFLGFNLLKINRKRILIIGSLIFIFFILILMSLTPKKQKSIKPSSIKALKSLPYLSYVVNDNAIEKNGVTKYDQRLCNKGINIYNSFLLPGAYLLDMDGNVLHTWLPKKSPSEWYYVKMAHNGDLLVSIRDSLLMRLTWDSDIKWEKNLRAHHDITIANNKDIYTLSRKNELYFRFGIPVPILNDYLIILSKDGKIKKEISFFKILKNKIAFKKIVEIYIWTINPINFLRLIKQKSSDGFIFTHDSVFDILHNNTLTIIDKNISRVCKKGDVLISVRQLDTIGIIDIQKEKLIWSWGPENIDKQHHPTLLKNGNILIFDNGTKKEQSRIIELDPFAKKITWEYKGNPPESFFTAHMGAAQRCPNGNTLITESSKGHVFEITKTGEIVWEFYNPIRKNNGKRAVIYRMMRINDPENYPLLKKLK